MTVVVVTASGIYGFLQWRYQISSGVCVCVCVTFIKLKGDCIYLVYGLIQGNLK